MSGVGRRPIAPVTFSLTYDQEVAVDTLLIFLTCLGTAYLASRFANRGPFTLADLVIGVFGALVGLSMAQLLSVEGAAWGPGLPLFFACVLTLGLESLQHRSLLR